MRLKVLLGALAAGLAFLLATNPLVAQAAAFITSADIVNDTIRSKDLKNNGVKGKDVRDGTLTSGDVANGTLTHPDLTTGSIGIARGYAWMNQAATPIGVATPLTSAYLYNSSGGNVTVNRSATGAYGVTFTGLSWDPGNVQVTAYGSNAYCNVGSWGSPTVFVDCYDPAGAPVDSRFTVAVFE